MCPVDEQHYERLEELEIDGELDSATRLSIEDQVDLFQAALAQLLGLERPLGLSDQDWRELRADAIRAREEEAAQLTFKAAAMVDEALAARSQISD